MQHTHDYTFGDASLPIRFWSKVTVDTGSGCWLWTGAATSTGYGSTLWEGRAQSTHRVAYMVLTGKAIPDGLTLDHLCRAKRCVNPAHLEPVTSGENTMRRWNSHEGLCAKGHRMTRGEGSERRYCPTCRAEKARPRTLRTHCPRGHEYTPDNTYRTTQANGAVGRECKTCKKYYAKHGHYPDAVA